MNTIKFFIASFLIACGGSVTPLEDSGATSDAAPDTAEASSSAAFCDVTTQPNGALVSYACGADGVDWVWPDPITGGPHPCTEPAAAGTTCIVLQPERAVGVVR